MDSSRSLVGTYLVDPLHHDGDRRLARLARALSSCAEWGAARVCDATGPQRGVGTDILRGEEHWCGVVRDRRSVALHRLVAARIRRRQVMGGMAPGAVLWMGEHGRGPEFQHLAPQLM